MRRCGGSFDKLKTYFNTNSTKNEPGYIHEIKFSPSQAQLNTAMNDIPADGNFYDACYCQNHLLDASLTDSFYFRGRCLYWGTVSTRPWVTVPLTSLSSGWTSDALLHPLCTRSTRFSSSSPLPVHRWTGKLLFHINPLLLHLSSSNR